MKPYPDASLVEFVREQLSALPDVTAKRMFGGWGLYCGEAFFAIISDGRLYLKASPDLLPEFDRLDLPRFQPNERQTLKNYREVPVDVLEDSDTLTRWARMASGGK